MRINLSQIRKEDTNFENAWRDDIDKISDVAYKILTQDDMITTTDLCSYDLYKKTIDNNLLIV
jgi:hypothetical protein